MSILKKRTSIRAHLIRKLSNEKSPAVVTLAELHQHMEQQEWDVLRSKLDIPDAAKVIQQNDTENQPTLLLACQKDAPCDIIRKLVQIKPELLHEKDGEFRHTPMHDMCLKPITSETADLIAFFSEQEEQCQKFTHCSILSSVDSCGMTPLHLLSMNPCKTAHAVRAFHALIHAGPAALTVENDEDETPLELFLVSQCPDMYEEEKFQCEVMALMHKSSKVFQENIRAVRGEMYRLQCRQQNLYLHHRMLGGRSASQE